MLWDTLGCHLLVGIADFDFFLRQVILLMPVSGTTPEATTGEEL